VPSLYFKTQVSASLPVVKAGFTRELFEALSPPFPPVKVLRFDGCAVGDEVHLELSFIVATQHWVSVITEAGETKTDWWFVDVGRQLPFFLASWRHEHRVETTAQGTVIIDSIHYTGPWGVVGWLFYPALWGQFAARSPLYRTFFAGR
jgi:ligand-binding SRPBCC domain-containing protein